MSTNNICLYKAVKKKYTGCNLKTTEFLDCALIGVCAVIRTHTVLVFRFIDSDEDGVISVKDVYNLMMGLGEMLDDDELFGMVTMADLDCDGKLTFKG